MTKRAFLIGLFMSVFVSLWPAYSTYVVRSIRADYAHLSLALLIPLVPLLLLNNIFSRRGKGLTGAELILISSMGMAAALSQGEWLSGYFLGVVTAPTYFASAENGWAETLLTYLPSWTIVADRTATVAFYEGILPGVAFPWQTWTIPLLWWGTLFLAVTLANLCLVVIFRRQWMEHERLPFPLAAGLLEFTGQHGQQGTLSTLIRNPRFQIGFFIVLVIFLWEIASWFTHLIPPLYPTTDRVINIGRGFPYVRFKMNPVTMAFGYFTESEVLFSIWFFHYLTVLQVGVMNRLGFEMGSPDLWCSYHPAVGWESFGGLVVFVIWGVWVSRAHLAAVFRKAFTRHGTIDDSEELIPFRGAVSLFLACALYSAFFFWQMGLSIGPLLAFWGATLILYLGFARIIVETGLIFMRTPITAQAFAWHLFGITGIGPASATALGLAYTFVCDAKTFGVTTLAHIPRLGLAMNAHKRRLIPLAICIAFVLGTLAVWTFIIYQGNYKVGSYNFGSVSFNGSGDGAVGIWSLTATRIRSNDFGTDWVRLGWLGFGAVFTAGLYAIRYRFPGLGLHPIGFAIAGSDVLRSGISSIFLIWAAKVLILRLGGLESYRRNTPLFMGLLMGYLASMVLMALADLIWFPGQGNGSGVNGW